MNSTMSHVTGKSQQKIERLRHVMSHREADRVPASDFFWTGFLKQCKKKWGADFDPYLYFDLDYIRICPNVDPHIQPFKIIHESESKSVVRTGFGATVRYCTSAPMPSYEEFSVNIPAEMADFQFDDPADSRRFYQSGEDHINCVGDTLLRGIPAWDDRVNHYVQDLAVFGGAQMPYEYIWRIIGPENALTWMIEYPDQYISFVNRVGEFQLALCRAEIAAADGRLSGIWMGGDLAYGKGMLFSPTIWREVFMPYVKAIVDLCHDNGLLFIYHCCGNASAIFDDFAAIGIDAVNPIEAKAGLDVVKLKKTYAGRLAFCGNIDVRILERGSPDEIKREVHYKLAAAKGGGWIFHSDHSVSGFVTPESYLLALNTLRELGSYPLDI